MTRLILCMLFLGSTAMAKDYVFESPEKQVNLLELYSSQGCSSCPPAENWVKQFKTDPDLWNKTVPVVFHVDYWNRIGWVDPFSKAEFTKRQIKQRSQDHVSSVYTPGFLINGQEWTGFFGDHKKDSFNQRASSNEKAGVLRVEIKNQLLDAKYLSALTDETLTLNVAQLAMNEVTEIKAGENKGRKVTESFVVLSLDKFDSQDEAWSVPFVVTPKTKAVAVWISKSRDLTPIQATGGLL